MYHETKFRELLTILMMITCGLSDRGTEMTSLPYVNTIEGDRSIYVEDGQIMFITEYHKSMALMDEVKVCQERNLGANGRLFQDFYHTESVNCWRYI